MRMATACQTKWTLERDGVIHTDRLHSEENKNKDEDRRGNG